MDDEKQAEPLPYIADPRRLRREHRPEQRAGAAIEKAAGDAEERVNRMLKGPAPSDEERALIASSPRRRVELYAPTLVSDLCTSEQVYYTLVPEGEADLQAGRISLGSAVGRALFQAAPGDIVKVRAPGGEQSFRVLQVR